MLQNGRHTAAQRRFFILEQAPAVCPGARRKRQRSGGATKVLGPAISRGFMLPTGVTEIFGNISLQSQGVIPEYGGASAGRTAPADPGPALGFLSRSGSGRCNCCGAAFVGVKQGLPSSAFIGTAFSQSTPKAADPQWSSFAGQTRRNLLKLAALMDGAKPEVLVYITLPTGASRQAAQYESHRMPERRD